MPAATVFPFPTPRKVPSRTTRDTKNYLTDVEMDQLLKAAKGGRYGVRDHAMLLLGYQHGLRVSELVGLRRDDLRLDEGRIWVARLKGSTSMDQHLTGVMMRALRAWLRARDTMRGRDLPWLFLSERGPMSRKAVNYLIAAAGQRAGLPHVHPHMLRHSCGYALANHGIDIRVIQDYLGHKDIQHTVSYTRLSPKRFDHLWD